MDDVLGPSAIVTEYGCAVGAAETIISIQSAATRTENRKEIFERDKKNTDRYRKKANDPRRSCALIGSSTGRA